VTRPRTSIPPSIDLAIYKYRNRIERTLDKLKQVSRVAADMIASEPTTSPASILPHQLLVLNVESTHPRH
jgi:transposase